MYARNNGGYVMKEYIISAIGILAFLIILGMIIYSGIQIQVEGTQLEKANVNKLKQSGREEVMREVVGRGYAEWVVDSNSVVGIKWK